jgi:eukaryotic-like serine/threonine-protein kinase
MVYTESKKSHIQPVTDLDYPAKIDRFTIHDVLGRGAQGIVYLAHDPQLDRDVAIKSVSLKTSFQQQYNIDNLLQEARTVSKLQHPNIVSIYDVGSDKLTPYLVLEYVKGESLHSLIKKDLSEQQAIHIMRDVLNGVSAAHAKGIIHCDLKPANIIITPTGQAKVADFGLALLADSQQDDESQLAGTPQYMAPEYIETRQHQTVSDVFSLGLIFYQLLTGKLAVDGDDVYQLLNAIANQPITPPSSIKPEIDEKLNALIMKALQKDPEDRYQNATEMLFALENTLALTEAIKQSHDSDATVQFLLRRMNHKKDFPAFSRTIGILNRASNSDTESLSTVSNAILKDISLTNKVLRVVNSAYYNRGYSKISTISRAVIMLGINPVKSLAVSLLLFEHLQNKSQAQQLMEDAVTSLFSALMANDIAGKQQIQQREEAFLCALLQQLGKLLVRFYLHEESLAIDQQIQQYDMEENTAVLKVLGTSYHKLGMAVAKEWGFPDQIILSMKPMEDNEFGDKSKHADPLRVIANYSNQVIQVLKKPKDQQQSALDDLTKKYAHHLKINTEQVNDLINNSQKELRNFAQLINFNLERSAFYQQLNDEETPDDSDQASKLTETSFQVLQENLLQPGEDQYRPEKALTDGIQDITNTLTGDYTINQVMQMVLETIFRALPGSRVILGLRDKPTNCIVGKFGYGDKVDELIEHFRIPLAYQADVFHVAFKNNVDIKIDNTHDENIKDKIPDWYHRKIGSSFFILFPIVIKHSPIAVLYIDSTENRDIKISDDQLSLLKTLRNQAILAIKNLN